MSSLKMSVFTIALGFSIGVLAAENIDRNTERDRSMNNTHNCMGLTGTDRALCDQEMDNHSTNSKANDNLRINRNTGTNMRDDARPRDLNSKDLNSKDLQSIDNQNRHIKPSNTTPNGTQPSSPSAVKHTIENSSNPNSKKPNVGNMPTNSNSSNTGTSSSGAEKLK